MKLNPWICAAMIVGTMVAIATGEARAQSSAADPVTEEVYRGELVSYPGPWAFQLGKSGIILVTDEELEALADPDSLAGHPAVVAAAAEGRDDLEGEDILAVVWQAYRSVTGADGLPRPADPVAMPELDPDWDFDFDDWAEMERRLPRLAALHDDGE